MRLANLAKTYPALAEDAKAIELVDQHVQGLPLRPFFEPVSVTLVSKGKRGDVLNGKREVLGVGPEELTSWTRHVALGTRCRMRALEDPIVGHLQAGQTMPAMILLRSHLEAAALAAHCLRELTAAARQGSVETLKELIPKTLFGTALKKHRDKVSVGELLKVFEGDTVQICSAIDSLDRFYYQEQSEGKLCIAYSVLCEFAHPNHRGVKDFMVASERPGGWEITYQLEASADPQLVARGLETLLVSMRAGYAAGELLLSWEFREQDGQLVARGPEVGSTSGGPPDTE
jgi:hypothetical protein